MKVSTILNLAFAICLIATISATVVYGATLLLTIPTSGNLLSDATLTSSPASIAWGDITKGTSVQKTTTITNIGEISTTTLTVTYPNLPTGYTMSVSGLPSTLAPSQSASVTFTLSATQSATADPIFDIKIDQA